MQDLTLPVGVGLEEAQGRAKLLQALDEDIRRVEKSKLIESAMAQLPPQQRAILALQIVLEELAGSLRELPRDREIVTFCDFGRQSAIAQAILERNGFRARYLKSKLPE